MDQMIIERIRSARIEVHASDTTPERKDSMQSMLDHAHKCANGTPDKVGAIAEAMSYLIVQIVREEARESGRLGDAIDKAINHHSESCKVGRVPRTTRDLFLSVASQYPLLAVLAVGWAAERGWLSKIVDIFTK